MSTTKKFESFINEPMGEKHVIEVPGVGKKTAEKLGSDGIEKAYQLQGQYLLQGKNESEFNDMLQDKYRMNTKNAGQCTDSISQYTNRNT
uniref:Barrier to autointegration factor n=1 Tax=Strongyloides papillosus TaxID=174720 RepID=A0A0N5BU16_STREA